MRPQSRGISNCRTRRGTSRRASGPCPTPCTTTCRPDHPTTYTSHHSPPPWHQTRRPGRSSLSGGPSVKAGAGTGHPLDQRPSPSGNRPCSPLLSHAHAPPSQATLPTPTLPTPTRHTSGASSADEVAALSGLVFCFLLVFLTIEIICSIVGGGWTVMKSWYSL